MAPRGGVLSRLEHIGRRPTPLDVLYNLEDAREYCGANSGGDTGQHDRQPKPCRSRVMQRGRYDIAIVNRRSLSAHHGRGYRSSAVERGAHAGIRSSDRDSCACALPVRVVCGVRNFKAPQRLLCSLLAESAADNLSLPAAKARAGSSASGASSTAGRRSRAARCAMTCMSGRRFANGRLRPWQIARSCKQG